MNPKITMNTDSGIHSALPGGTRPQAALTSTRL
jgi:hypothetical protein